MADALKDVVLQLLINGKDNTGPALKSAESNVSGFESATAKISAGIKSALTFAVIIKGGEEFIKLADQYTLIDSRVKQATKSNAEYKQVQDGLFRISQDVGGELESTVALYARTASAVRLLGYETADSLRLNQLITQSFRISGATTVEAAQGTRQLSQALGSFVLRGEEFNTIMESAPRLAQAMADGMGVPITQLRALAEAGELTSDKVIKALLGQGDKISAEYGKIGPTVEKADQQIANSILRQVGLFNQATGATEAYAASITKMSKWLDEADIANSHFAEYTALTIDVLKHFFDSEANGAEIHARFVAARNGTIQSGQQLAQSETQTAEAVKAAQAVQTEALDKQQAKLKEGTTILEQEYARRIEAINRELEAKKAAALASSDPDNVQAQQIATAEKAALEARLAAIGDYGKRRLDAITQILGTQESIEKMGEINRKTAEKASLDARIAAYGDLSKAYGAVVDQLQGQWAREMDLFNKGNESLRTLALNHEQGVLAIQRMGMDERQKLKSQEQERDTAIARFKAEAAKGDQANETELNRLYGEAYKLVNQVTQAKVTGSKSELEKSGEVQKGVAAVNSLYDLQQGTLGKINAQHKANADTLLPSLEQAKAKLGEVNGVLRDLDKQLANAKELKIQLDAASVDAVKSTIRALTATEVKTIVVQTVQQGTAAASSSDSQPVQAKQSGGLIAQLAEGAFIRRNGLLPGYGGGDRVPAMLEDGEFVVNKQSTAAALPFLQHLNQNPILFMASGGAVGSDAANSVYSSAFSTRLEQKLATLLNMVYASSTGASQTQAMDQILRDIRQAIQAAPVSLQPSLQQQVAEKLGPLVAQAQQSYQVAVARSLDPNTVLQNSPGLVQRLEDNLRYLKNAVSLFGGEDLSAAALGGFAQVNPTSGKDLGPGGNSPTSRSGGGGFATASATQPAKASPVEALLQAMAATAKARATAQAQLPAVSVPVPPTPVFPGAGVIPNNPVTAAAATPTPANQPGKPAASGNGDVKTIIIKSPEAGKTANLKGTIADYDNLVDLLKFHALTS